MSTTRFRAYQLGNEGSSFSYCHNGHLTLIEARLTDASAPNVAAEIKAFANGRLGCLHITSWDDDHCAPGELRTILEYLKPARVECPGYLPHTETGEESLAIITAYDGATAGMVQQSPDWNRGLVPAKAKGIDNVILWPYLLGENSNDNSTAKMFRTGHFSVLSLGDLESADIAEKIVANDFVRQEVDVMILAHHGADNGFTSEAFIQAVKPRIAVCSSNYDNQYEHPRQEIRDLLYAYGIPIYTTKTGDVIVKNTTPGQVGVINLIADNEEVSSTYAFSSKTTLPA